MPAEPDATLDAADVSAARSAAVQPAKGRPPAKVHVETLKTMFDRPQPEAAKELGISLTTLKQVCRRLGLHRWPYRRPCKLSRSRVTAQSLEVSSNLATVAHVPIGSALEVAPRDLGGPEPQHGGSTVGTSKNTNIVTHDHSLQRTGGGHTQGLNGARGRRINPEASYHSFHAQSMPQHGPGPGFLPGPDTRIGWHDDADVCVQPAPYHHHGLDCPAGPDQASWGSSISMQISRDLSRHSHQQAQHAAMGTMVPNTEHFLDPPQGQHSLPFHHHHAASQGNCHGDEFERHGPWPPENFHAGCMGSYPTGLGDPFSDHMRTGGLAVTLAACYRGAGQLREKNEAVELRFPSMPIGLYPALGLGAGVTA